VTVRVSHSTLNYKDGLAITGKGPVVRKFPMVPGIDLVGTVEESSHHGYKPGDAVLLNGWGVGEGHWGAGAKSAVKRELAGTPASESYATASHVYRHRWLYGNVVRAGT